MSKAKQIFIRRRSSQQGTGLSLRHGDPTYRNGIIKPAWRSVNRSGHSGYREMNRDGASQGLTFTIGNGLLQRTACLNQEK
jgi:hypothetical protein